MLRLGVEPVGDRLVAEPLGDTPLEHLADHRSLDGVDFQACLLHPLGPFGRHGMRHAVGAVAVLDPAGEYLGGGLGLPAVRAEHDGFVGGYQLHPGLLQAVLDLGRDVGAARDPVDRLADHDVEPAVGPLGLSQQISDPAIARDRDLELLVGAPVPPVSQILAAGLDVVEMGDDHYVAGQGVLAGT